MLLQNPSAAHRRFALHSKLQRYFRIWRARTSASSVEPLCRAVVFRALPGIVGDFPLMSTPDRQKCCRELVRQLCRRNGQGERLDKALATKLELTRLTFSLFGLPSPTPLREFVSACNQHPGRHRYPTRKRTRIHATSPPCFRVSVVSPSSSPPTACAEELFQRFALWPATGP